MDVYHKVLHKLCEITEGKNSKAVDFKDLVKKMGFHGNYLAIYKFLSNEGWITESPKADFVFITHWGVAEVKKSSSGADGDSKAEIRKETNRALAVAKELSVSLESFAESLDQNDFPPVESKLSELQNIINKIKSL